MDFDCPAGRDAGKYLDADGAKRGADVVAQRVHRACGGRTGRERRPDAAQEFQAGDAVEGTDSTTATVHPDPLAPVRLWMGASIRRVAHTVEFFFVGLFASATVACLGECLPCARFRYVLALLFCAVCSVGDQVHKIFVPGRHFDKIDLGFDAAGYVVTMLLVLLAAALVQRATCPIGARARH